MPPCHCGAAFFGAPRLHPSSRPRGLPSPLTTAAPKHAARAAPRARRPHGPAWLHSQARPAAAAPCLARPLPAPAAAAVARCAAAAEGASLDLPLHLLCARALCLRLRARRPPARPQIRGAPGPPLALRARRPAAPRPAADKFRRRGAAPPAGRQFVEGTAPFAFALWIRLVGLCSEGFQIGNEGRPGIAGKGAPRSGFEDRGGAVRAAPTPTPSPPPLAARLAAAARRGRSHPTAPPKHVHAPDTLVSLPYATNAAALRPLDCPHT
ncbi:MAG: hypothetical protein J3K34DRAFT_199588 [Monoraphidium minutum]|nr:MAG: hypothetical protein J3K34DRAFT_199588 [Monoraphidium minutum]